MAPRETTLFVSQSHLVSSGFSLIPWASQNRIRGLLVTWTKCDVCLFSPSHSTGDTLSSGAVGVQGFDPWALQFCGKNSTAPLEPPFFKPSDLGWTKAEMGLFQQHIAWKARTPPKPKGAFKSPPHPLYAQVLQQRRDHQRPEGSKGYLLRLSTLEM